MSVDGEDLDDFNAEDPEFLSKEYEIEVNFEKSELETIPDNEKWMHENNVTMDDTHQYWTNPDTGHEFYRKHGEIEWRKISNSKGDDAKKIQSLGEDESKEKIIELPKPEPKKGLTLRKTPKLPIVDEEVPLDELAYVIGPKYILNHIVSKRVELPETPEYPTLFDANNPLEGDPEEEEFQREKKRRINAGVLRHEKELRYRDRRSRFYGRGHVTRRKKRGRKDVLSTRVWKRGLRGNRKGISFASNFLPRILQSEPNNLDSIGHKIILHPLASSLQPIGNPEFAYLPKLKTANHMSFSILNTAEKLDQVPIGQHKSIVLRWSKTPKPVIRDLRVDGIDEEFNRLERVAFFFDRNTGKIREFIYQWRYPFIGLGVMFTSVIFVLSTW